MSAPATYGDLGLMGAGTATGDRFVPDEGEIVFDEGVGRVDG